MDPFLNYILIYLIGISIAVPGYFYVAYRRKMNAPETVGPERDITLGYYFHPISPQVKLSSQTKSGKRSEYIDKLNEEADAFLDCIQDDFWIKVAEYGDNHKQKCEEYFAYLAGFVELAVIMEYECTQYMDAMRFRHDDKEKLNRSAVDVSIDVMLFATCYRTFAIKLNLIDRRKAEAIYDFCKNELKFMEPKYCDIETLDNETNGLRKKP